MRNSQKKLSFAIFMVIIMTACIPKIITVISEKGAINEKTDPAAVRAIDVKIDIAGLRSAETITIPLPGKKLIQVIRKREDRFEKGRSAWFGVVEKDPGSFVLLSITSKAIAGRITTSAGKIYRISYRGDNIHQIVEIAGHKFPETRDDFVIPKIKEPEVPTATDCPDPVNNIDVMVVYTNAAKTGAGGADGMEALIYECIYLSNLAYQNSNITQRLNLVHYEEITYTESGNSSTDLGRLQNSSDTYMDNVHTLRDTYAADLVALIIENLDYCGRGYLLPSVSSAYAPYGFTVIKRSCAADNMSFPHELGHNMGARHNCASDSTLASPYDYNHGHLVSAPADGSGSSWRTVMAYSDCTSGPCTRIAYFSNPSLAYSPTSSASTDPLGTAASAGTCTADNHLTLNNTASTVAQYRCSSPSITNVWMRDSWNDTGLEPDPNTAGEVMWKSPYIWVRTVQDPTFLHQFEHQNPITGQNNWIYGKLINGGSTAASGNLRVYYANASVSLTWPSGWTLIGDLPVTINANTTICVEIPWTGVPGTGHYCLIARWVSAADPMTFTETSNITYNTRQNNNIIWRNVNIIAAPPDAGPDRAAFEMRNIFDGPVSLEFNDPALFPKRAFIENGEIYIDLEPEILAAWKKGGAKGVGIKEAGDRIQIIAVKGSIDNILMPREKRTKVIFSFQGKKGASADKYDFNVSQVIQVLDQNRKAGKKTLGGVSFEIYTYKR
ncbi:MAG: M12 family metallo-peptidase [Chrysiogenia bacterium]